MAHQEDFQATHYIDVDGDTVKTLVTNNPCAVGQWISKVKKIHRYRLHRLVVGLDTEWRPNFYGGGRLNPVATLQLCVGRRCLVLQLLHARLLPACLHNFLSDADFTFVGVGINDDIARLHEDHDLYVSKAVDLGRLAAVALGDESLRSASLSKLALEVADIDMEKPREVRLSAWDRVDLSYDQIRYACADAFASFEVGRVLKSWKYE